MKKYLSFQSYKDAFFTRFARILRRYLANTPLIWGDASRLSVGSNVHLVDAIINLRSGSVTIEDDVFFGHGVMLLTGKHSIRKKGKDRHESVPDAGRDITIRQGAWVASGALVIGPCTIGENAVIGAGSVVTGVIEAGAIHAGSPAAFVRQIDFDGPNKL